ncbi:MAG: SMC-Scp complex subunit ScpB [Lachnospiraceae bacterium]
MTRDYKKGQIEAILFTMGESVTLSTLAEVLELPKKEVQSLLHEMMAAYEMEQRGIRILELEDSYQMCSAREYYDILTKVAAKPKKNNLSDAMLEVLAIVAYQQPVTKSTIEKIRGVRSDHPVNKLLEYELIEERGRLEAPGRPILFGTTEGFLRQFGFSSVKELPQLEHEEMIEDKKLDASAEDAGEKLEQIEKNEIFDPILGY